MHYFAVFFFASWPMFVQSVPYESVKLIVEATLMVRENSNGQPMDREDLKEFAECQQTFLKKRIIIDYSVTKFVNLIVDLGYLGLVRLLEGICTQKIVTTSGKLRTLWCQMMGGYLKEIDFEKRIVPHISMRSSGRKSVSHHSARLNYLQCLFLDKHRKLKDWQAQQRQEFENLEIADEMPVREELFWQAQRVGAALLYTLIYGEMKELVERQLIDKAPKQYKANLGGGDQQQQQPASDQKRRLAASSSKRGRTTANKQHIVQEISNNNSDEEEEEEEGFSDNAYIEFWIIAVERAFRRRFEAESELLLKELDEKMSWRDFGPLKKSISEWKKMIELMGH